MFWHMFTSLLLLKLNGDKFVQYLKLSLYNLVEAGGVMEW